MRASFVTLLSYMLLVGPAAIAEEFPSCVDGTKLSPSTGTPKHSITLSWKASVPTNSKPRNQVAGYNIYRSESGHCAGPSKDCREINHVLIKGTTCVDYSVRSGRTYTYGAQAVSVSAVTSVFSNEAKATVP